MSKRFSLLLAIVATLLIASTLSAAGLGMTDATTANQTSTVTTLPARALPVASPLVLPVRFDPQPMANTCIDACRVQYFSCLDDCDKAPFPGCYDFCRFDVLYPCYSSCFGQ